MALACWAKSTFCRRCAADSSSAQEERFGCSPLAGMSCSVQQRSETTSCLRQICNTSQSIV